MRRWEKSETRSRRGGQVRGSLSTGQPQPTDNAQRTHARERPCVPSSATPRGQSGSCSYSGHSEREKAPSCRLTLRHPRLPVIVVYLVAVFVARLSRQSRNARRREQNLIIDIRRILQRDLKSLAPSCVFEVTVEVEVAGRKDQNPGDAGLHSPRLTLMNHVERFWKEETRSPGERDLFQHPPKDLIPRFSSARVFPRSASVRKRRVSEVWRLLKKNLCDTRRIRIRGAGNRYSARSSIWTP